MQENIEFITKITINFINNGKLFHIRKNALDAKDEKILSMLLENSKLTSQQISKKINVPITTVHNRIKKMEKSGVIKNYSLVIDNKKIGKEVSAYIFVTVNYPHEHQKKFSQEDTAKRIRALEGVEEVTIVAGDTDMIVRLNLASIDELNNFIIKKLRNIDGIDKTRTMVVLNQF